MTMGSLLLILLIPGVSLSLNPWNEKYPSNTQAIIWINTLCGIYRSQNQGEYPSGFKHISLEAYSTIQSSQPKDFISSMLQQASINNICRFSMSLTSDRYNRDKVTSIDQKTSEIKSDSLRLRIIVLTTQFLSVLYNSDFGWNSRETVLILLMDEETLNLDVRDIFKRVWDNFGVYNLFINILNNKTDGKVWIYDPFFRDNSKNGYGRAFEMELSDQSLFSRDVPSNFNGYPIKVGLFHSPPAAIRRSIEHDSLDDVHGLDGYMLKTFVKSKNFSVEICGPSDGVEYGSDWDNGTITGTMGDVANRRIDISFNSQYIKKYSQIEKHSELLEFSESVDEDRVCIIVPAPGEIPRWLRTFTYFHPTLWVCFLMSLIVASLFWRIMLYHHGKTPPGYPVVLLDTFMLFVGSPVRSVNMHSERMLVGGLLFLGLTAMGAFTGTLYHSFTNRMFYKPINTLEELDNSGLLVGTATGGLMDIFGSTRGDDDPDEYPVLKRLRNKVKYINSNKTWPPIRRTAEFGNIAAIRRFSSFGIVRHQYIGDGHTSLLHLIEECPQRYYLGYLLPKNSFIKNSLDKMIMRLKESGFHEFWKKKTIQELLHEQLAERKKLEELRPFSLYDMQSCFFILGVGLGIACCVLVGEIGIFYLARKR